MHEENISFVPQDYKRGKTKYVIVTGSVISGVGKGTFTSALSTLFQFYDLKVSMMKFDGYLNVDAGTLNPYRHGEVFVLDDGTETDLDLGSYERALHRNLSKDNYLTGGKLFKMIVDKERKGGYLGRDVQFVPHVTGEIKNFVRNLSMKDDADILIVEVGGTVGDLENSYFIEAMRELKNEEGNENVAFVNVTYIIQPGALGEQKSKAAQLGITNLLSLGVQPNLVVCRAEKPVEKSIREKIALVSNLQTPNVISLSDLSSIYDVPFFLRREKIDERFFEIFNIVPDFKIDIYERWLKFISGIKNPEHEIDIAIPGKYTGVHDSYISILKALEHASSFLKTKINIRWIETTEISNLEDAAKELEGIKGMVVPGGFGARGTEGKIRCVEYARKNNIPFLGLCFGFQLAVVEFARDVLGLEANSSEIDANTPNPVIDLLPEQKTIENLGGTMRLGGKDVLISQDSIAEKVFKSNVTRERFRHRYEVNPEYIKQIENAGLIFSGKAKEDERIMQILELKDNKFFMATQFHPELLSRPLAPNPMFVEFVRSCVSEA